MRPLILAVGFLVVAATAGMPAPLSADVLRFRSSVTPRTVNLVCEETDVITDVQTRDEVARRSGLVGRIEELNRLLDRMRAAGYRTGAGDRLTIELPLRLTYMRTLEFGARTDRRQVVLTARRTHGRLRVVVDQNAARYLRPENRARIDTLGEAWKNRMAAGVQRLRDDLDGAAYPWTPGEIDALGRRNRGTFTRNLPSFEFCTRSYHLRIVTEWRKQIDGPLGNP